MNIQNIVIDEVQASEGHRYVVRDDLLSGGTKQRAVTPWLRELKAQGLDHFVYSSPFCGYAQVALAIGCHELDLKCTLFCERDKRFDERIFHPFSLQARNFGAALIMTESLAEAEQFSEEYVANHPHIFKIPLGLNSERFRAILKRELEIQWQTIQTQFKDLSTLWLPLGSGTLAQVMNKVVPEAIHIKCVNVHVLEETDQRIEKLKQIPRIEVINAPMAFHEKATELPTHPSNIFYDAKVWNFVDRDGQSGDLWWNVGP